MQAPETVRLRYIGVPNIKQIYRSHDKALKKYIYLDSTGDRYPSEDEVSMEFANRIFNKPTLHKEFEIVGDRDGSLRERIKAWMPESMGVPVGQASKNIRIIEPDGTVREFPPGTIINVHPAGTVEEKPAEVAEPAKDSLGESKPTMTRMELEKKSKPKIARWAKANLGLDLDPRKVSEGGMSKIEMVDAVLEAIGG